MAKAYSKLISCLIATSVAAPIASAKPMPLVRPPAHAGHNVGAMFQEALKLYQSGRFPQALAAFYGLLRRYPRYEPAAIYYAKTLYRMDRIPDSYGVFARLNPQTLDVETSYEYGQACFTQHQWAAALYGFRRVPEGHSLYDLANYYGAIAAMRLKRYQDAEDMLEKAVVLPDKLAATRALYLKHIEELRLLHEKEALAQETIAEKAHLAAELKATKERLNSKPDTGPTATVPNSDETYVHKGFRSLDRNASVGFNFLSDETNYSGFNDNTSVFRKAYFNFTTNPVLPLPLTQKHGQAACGMQLKFAAYERDGSGHDHRLIVTDDTPDIVRMETESNLPTSFAHTGPMLGTPSDHAKAGNMDLSPWVEVPLPQDLWLQVAGDFYLSYPDFERGGRGGSRTGTLALNGRKDIYSYGLEADYQDVVGTNLLPVSHQITAKATFSATFPSDVLLGITVSHNEYGYYDQTIDGPDSASIGQVSLTQLLPFGFKLSGLAAAELDSNFLAHGIPSFDTVAADGQVYTGKIELGAAPLPWVYIDVYQLFAKTNWSIANPSAADAFQKNVPNYLARLSIDASINVYF